MYRCWCQSDRRDGGRLDRRQDCCRPGNYSVGSSLVRKQRCCLVEAFCGKQDCVGVGVSLRMRTVCLSGSGCLVGVGVGNDSLVGKRRCRKDGSLIADSLLVRKQKGCLGEAIAWFEVTVLRLRLLLVRETGNNNIILNS